VLCAASEEDLKKLDPMANAEALVAAPLRKLRLLELSAATRIYFV